MAFKKYGLPIFVLYMLTSSVLMAFFCYFYYQNATETLKHHTQKELNFTMREILTSAKFGVQNLDFDKFDDIKINFIDNKSGKFLKKDFDFNDDEFLKFRKNHAKKGGFLDPGHRFLKFNGEIYLIEILKTMPKHSDQSYTIILKSDDFSENKAEIISEILAFFASSILFFLIISYFIIRLSFRPLIEKINSQNAFIADATHEINTPLSVILMSIEMFKISPEKYLANIKTAAKTLSGVYENLVNLNLKTTPNNLSEVDLKALFNERLEYFSVMLAEKNLSLKADLSEVCLKTDEFKIKNIFDNILSNAIKYCFENSEISVVLNQKGFEISNYGEEISKENKSKIFTKFTRFNTQKGGFGIGLSLVKKYCDELNFKISCQSQNSKTSFFVKF